MKIKPIKVDWDELEDAFNNQNEELVYYLDLISGHVHLDGEGDEFDDDDDDRYDTTPPPPSQPARDDETRAYIHPPDTATKIDWLRRFIDEDSDLEPELVAGLQQALAADDPPPAIRGAMNRYPEGRDRWYLYRSVQIQRRIVEWIAEKDVKTVDPAPWT